jgi:hypothetical protein
MFVQERSAAAERRGINCTCKTLSRDASSHGNNTNLDRRFERPSITSCCGGHV